MDGLLLFYIVLLGLAIFGACYTMKSLIATAKALKQESTKT